MFHVETSQHLVGDAVLIICHLPFPGPFPVTQFKDHAKDNFKRPDQFFKFIRCCEIEPITIWLIGEHA